MAHYCNLTFKAIEWLNGELLGDGSLASRHQNSAKYSHTSKHLEHCEYVSNTLKSFGIQQAGKLHCYKPHNVYYQYGSLTYVQLKPLYVEWYPDGKKVVPRGIILTPITCRQWYMGDGCLLYTQAGSPYIQIATCAFPVDDVEWLITQLQELGFLTTRHTFNNIIQISTCSTKEFLRYIGKSPVKCYEYKWRAIKEEEVATDEFKEPN